MTRHPRVLRAPDTPFVAAIRDLLGMVDAAIPSEFGGMVQCVIVGGCAVHLYTGWRVSSDLDAAFAPPLLLPEAPIVSYKGANGPESIVLDRNYTDVLAMMHPDWRDDAWPWEQFGRVQAMVISPLDLAVSKVARLADNDRGDIAQLANHGLLSANDFERRCREAKDYYVGAMTFIRHNVTGAVEIIRANSPGRKP